MLNEPRSIQVMIHSSFAIFPLYSDCFSTFVTFLKGIYIFIDLFDSGSSYNEINTYCPACYPYFQSAVCY